MVQDEDTTYLTLYIINTVSDWRAISTWQCTQMLQGPSQRLDNTLSGDPRTQNKRVSLEAL